MQKSDKELRREARRDVRSKRALNHGWGFTAIYIFVSIITSVAEYTLLREVSNIWLVFAILRYLLFFVLIALIIRYLVVNKRVYQELLSKAMKDEEERLAKIKASMTPAEWEAYKLQMENNRLLRDLKRRGPSTTTTTTYGFSEDS